MATITKQFTFSVGQVADPNQVNADIDALYNQINLHDGSITALQADNTTFKKIIISIDSFPRQGGETDDTPRINRAIASLPNSGGIIRYSSATYQLNSTVNNTNKTNVIHEGLGSENTQFQCNTGGIAWDCTGAPNTVFRNLKLSNSGTGITNASTVGILFARSTTNAYVQFCSLENVDVLFLSNSTANGNKGTVGIYNNAAEMWKAKNVNIMADNPVVFTANNTFNIASALATHNTTITSMSLCEITGASNLSIPANGIGAPLTIENGLGIHADNTYFTKDSTATYDYAVYVNGGTNIYITGHVETLKHVLYGAGSFNGGKIDVTKFFASGDAHAMYLNNVVMGGFDINIRPLSGSVSALLLDGVLGSVFRNNICRMYNGQSIGSNFGSTTSNLGNQFFMNDLPKQSVGDGILAPHSTWHVGGSFATGVSTPTGNYTVADTDCFVLCQVPSANSTVTLPDATTCRGREYTFKKYDNNAYTVTIATTASQTIDGASTYVLSTYNKYVKVISNGANWYVIGNN